MLFYRIVFTTFLTLLAYACSPDSGDEMNLTQSATTTLTTSLNALGSFQGQRISNLQINKLEPGEYTLQFSVIEPVIDNCGSATYAIVSWKVDGQQFQRIVSVYSGAAISGVANSVDVYLLDQSNRAGNPFPTDFTVVNGSKTVVSNLNPITMAAGETIYFDSQPGVGYALAAGVNNSLTFQLATPYTGTSSGAATAYAIATYKVGVSLSKGTRPTTMQPPVLFTEITQIIPQGNAAIDILLPADAGILSTLITVIVNGTSAAQAEAVNGIVNFLDPSHNRLGAYIPDEFPTWFPVPPGTQIVELVNNSSTKDLAFSLQWGIEG
jgi:hypothetical protein